MKDTEKSSPFEKIFKMRRKLFFKKVPHLTEHEFSMETYPVRVVVTGMERSGTTLLSTLLKQSSSLNGGFECGFLVADTPRDFPKANPWYDWMQEPVSRQMWGVSAKHMDYICSSNTWEEAYQNLIQYSPIFKEKENQQICDKTPHYLCCLDNVLDKLPDFVPCIVIEKDITNLWRSHKKRQMRMKEFIPYYRQYYSGLRQGLARHSDRIHRVQYGALCQHLQLELQKIFSILGLDFNPEFALQRRDEILTYYQNVSMQATPLNNKELTQLESLKNEFSDLFDKPL